MGGRAELPGSPAGIWTSYNLPLNCLMSENDCVFFFTKFIYMSDHPQICILSTRQNIDCGEVDPGGYYVDEMLLFHYAECRWRPGLLIVEYN